MGIINATPDSFSDGGRHYGKEAAVQRFFELVDQGADIIDIGGESTRPFSDPISAEEELARVIPIIKETSSRTDVPISIDTYKPEVARKALEAGASIINDIYGLRIGDMAGLAGEAGVPIIIMHMQGTPQTMQTKPVYEDVISDISSFFKNRIEVALDSGVIKENIILDPGIGFGKTLQHNLEIMNKLDEFKILGRILVGPSRKSFLGGVLKTETDQRLEGTIAAVILSYIKGVDIVRVHDIIEVKRALDVAEAILNSNI